MALREMKTLGEMAAEVLDRCGMPAGLSDDQLPQIHGFLREAQTWLWNKFPSIRQRTSIAVDTTADVTVYEIPDAFDAGSIESIEAKDVDGVRWRLESGIRPEDRNAVSTTLGAATAFEPSRFRIIDGDVEVIGAPTDQIAALVFTGLAAAAPLTEEEHRPTVDDEAMIRYAATKLKAFKKQISGQEAQAERAELEDYVGTLDSNQGTSESFTLGTGWVDPAEAQPTGRRRDRPWWRADRGY